MFLKITHQFIPGAISKGMDASFSQGCRVMIFGHGECLHWFNFCQARGIQNLGFPPHVIVRVLARPSATLPFLASKNPVIADFSPHILVINLGMFDLLQVDMDPLDFADRFWHILGLITVCMPGLRITKVIILGQLRRPMHLVPDRLYSVRVEAFHARLLRRVEGSRALSLLFLGGDLGLFSAGAGNANDRTRDMTRLNSPCARILSIIRRRAAVILSARSEYNLFL